jgi:hypothetical protein
MPAGFIAFTTARKAVNVFGPCFDLTPRAAMEHSGTVSEGESIVYAASGYDKPLKMRLRC